jgi:hypothetical protein
MKLLSRFLVLSAVIVLTLPASVALACSCMEFPPPVEAMGQADAVFTGRVLSAVPIESTNGYVYTMRVHAVWKGAAIVEVRVETDEPAMCGVWLQPGETYLVYAGEHQGMLSTGNCTRTREISFAGEDLAELGSPLAVEGMTLSVGMFKVRYE